MTKQTAQLFNQILCISIVPLQCTFYSFLSSVNVSPNWQVEMIFRQVFSYMPCIHCTVQNVLRFWPNMWPVAAIWSLLYKHLHMTGLHISSLVLVLVTALQSFMKKFTFHHKYYLLYHMS
jgi:hypothetical protein